MSVIGVKIGNKFGDKYEKKAEIMGGVILILLGVKILLEHLGIINFWVKFGDGGKIVPIQLGKRKSILLKIKVVIMEKTRIATFLLKSINEFEINLI